MFAGEREGLGTSRLCIHELFKYFKSNLHQNKLVVINVEKKVICNVHFKSETKLKIQHKKNKFGKKLGLLKKGSKYTCAWRK